MNEQIIEKIKKEYLSHRPSENQAIRGWEELYDKLQLQREVLNFSPVRPALAFAALIILLFASVFTISRTARPGDSLYAAKVLSDRVISEVTGNYEANVEGRTQDVIEASDSSEGIDEAIKQYEKTLEDAKKEADKKGKSQEYRKFLEEQEQKLDETIRAKPQNQYKLNEAIKHTRRIRGEVEGVKDKPANGNHSEEQKQR